MRCSRLSTSALMLVLDWRIFVVAISVWAVTMILSRIVSLSSILAAASFPVSTFIFSYLDYHSKVSQFGVLPISYLWITTAIALGFAVILIWKHRANIVRLKNGTEKKMSIKHSQES